MAAHNFGRRHAIKARQDRLAEERQLREIDILVDISHTLRKLLKLLKKKEGDAK